MDEALRRAGHSAAVNPAPAPESASADLVEPIVELNDYAAEVAVKARQVDHRPPGASAVSVFEVEAMHAIGRVLTGVPDADARARVLRWATESFVEGGLQPLCREPAAAFGRLSATSMIHSFVADFQQLVREWHGCFDHPDEPVAGKPATGS